MKSFDCHNNRLRSVVLQTLDSILICRPLDDFFLFLNASFYKRDLGIARRVQSLSLFHLVCYLVGLDSGIIQKSDLSSVF